LLNARLNEEFPILEKRDEWYHIRLIDGREGWIHENDLQVISEAQTGAGFSQSDLGDVLEFSVQALTKIKARRDSAAQIYSRVTNYFENLPAAEKESRTAAYAKIKTTREQINRFASYVTHYHQKYALMYLPPVNKTSLLDHTRGALTFLIGNSMYENIETKSATSRNIAFTGRKVLNDRSEISADFNTRREILQTPYTTNNYRLVYRYNFARGLRLTNYLGVNTFADDSLARNSFNQWNAGYNLYYLLKPGMEIFNDFNFLKKNLKEDGPNAYSNGLLNAGLRYRPDSHTLWTFATRGLIQSSDAAYLDFQRYVPQVVYQRQNRDGFFQGLFDWEILGYGDEAQQNNYQRERLEFQWQRPRSTRRVLLSAKQYPHNERLNYFKLGGEMQWLRYQPGSSTRTNMSLLFALFPQMTEQGGNYLDFRMDRSQTKSRLFNDFNVFARLWSDPNGPIRRYHLIDFYQSIGYNWGTFRLGPLLGAHLLIHSDEKFFRKDGNSLRTGVDLKGNFMIQRAILNISAQYEYDILFGEEVVINPNTGEITPGELATRNPTTLQLLLDFRVPVSRSFDFQMLINKYKINLDLGDDEADRLLATRDRVTFLAGLVYRFNR